MVSEGKSFRISTTAMGGRSGALGLGGFWEPLIIKCDMCGEIIHRFETEKDYSRFDHDAAVQTHMRVCPNWPDWAARGAGPASQRGQVLLDAHKVINGERQNVYGSPEDSFALIARYWQTYLESAGVVVIKDTQPRSLAAEDVALMMTLFKIAREANQHKADNIVDAAGYLGIYGSMQESKA